MRVMLVDDEQPCLDELEYLLDRYEDIEITEMFTNPFRALSVALRREIVFVTAHAKLLSEAKRVGSHAFLLKPVSKTKLKAVLEDLIRSK